MSGAWPVGRSLIGSLALAVRDINANPAIIPGKRLEYVWKDDGCDRLKSLAEFSDVLGRFDAIDGLIGPGCAEGCEFTATLAQSKNIPQVSPTCAAESLSSKADFPLFVRTTSPYAKWAPAIVAFMRWAAWTRLSIVAHASMGASVGPLRSELEQSGFRVGIEKQFESDHFEVAPGDSSPLVSVRAAGVRFVMVYAFGPNYRAIAVEARKLEMSQGWAWMGIDMAFGTELGANGHDLAIAQAALHGWIYFAPSRVASQEFFDRVKAASITDFGQRLGDDDSTNLYAANLYDAVMLFALTAGKHLTELSNGKLIVEAMMNASFEGKTGRVELDQNGDMKESISVMNYALESGTMRGRRIGVYDALSHRYSPVQNGTMALVWPGNVHAIPADMAASPTEQGSFDTTWILVGAGVSAVVVVAVVTILVRKRHAHLQAIMLQLFTEVSPASHVSPRFLQRLPSSSQSAQPPVRFVHSSRGHTRYHLHGSSLVVPVSMQG
jgi:ABC-type branched-subunit amino acid transport system substrate-binding protein